MGLFTDMLGRKVAITQKPQRIVSLVPSQTEYLFDLGLAKEVVGITKFCIHPDWAFRSKQRVGGTKNLNIETIRSLKPDLIIANKEENVKEQIDAVAALAPVWISDVNNMQDATEMMASLAEICDRSAVAQPIIDKISKDFSALPIETIKGMQVAYAIWYQPWMFVGANNFIHDLLEKMGFRNVFGQMDRYPEVSLEALKAAAPNFVLLSSEPFPFKDEHMQEIKQVLPNCKVLLVDGEMFSWYGSRLMHSAEYFRNIFA